MKEIFKDIKGYEGKYLISNFGKVISLKKSILLTLKKINTGYWVIQLWKNNRYENFLVHRLVGIHFVPNPTNLPQINHKDSDKENCRADNLEWSTQKENIIHAIKSGKFNPRTMVGRSGKDSPVSKKTGQYNLVGELIKKWENAADIKRELGLSLSGISMCCSGKKKHCGGYIWRHI